MGRVRVLVDGHNALGALRIRAPSHEAKRDALLARVAAVSREATVFFDAVAVLLGTMWWNVRRFNRALCRSPVSDWAFLLAFLAFGIAALDPVRVAHLAEDATDELGDIIATMAG